MARTLVQALEGIHFPADKSSIIEYAQRQEIAARALGHLEQLPDRQYKDMTELFSALPSKRQIRFKVVQPPHRQRNEESRAEPEPEHGQARDQAESAPEATAEGNEPPPGENGQAWRPVDWTPPLMGGQLWQQPFGQGFDQMVQVATCWQRLWLDWFSRSLEIYGKAMPRWPGR